MTMMVVLPTAGAGLITASILGVARAVGETAPVLLTAGSSQVTNANPLAHVQTDLPVQLLQFIKSPVGNNRIEAWGTALVLVSIVLFLFVLARTLGVGPIGTARRRLRRSRRRKYGSRSHTSTDNSPTVNLGDNPPFISTA
jgi:phosphate transport system permease protein